MKTLQAFTNEIDDLDIALDELKDQIDMSELLTNSCAIVFCGHEVDTEDLIHRLKDTFKIPFIGCTSIGMLNSKGYTQSSITVTILTADDCSFITGITDEIICNEEMDKLADKYHELSAKLPEKEKIIITYSAWDPDIEADAIVDTLNDASEGIPVFGGIASDGWSFNEDFVFCGSEMSRKKIVLLMICGNIDPIFSIAHSVKKSSNMNKVVTRSKGNVVYTIDDQPIVDFLEENGFGGGKTDVMLDYLGTPFKIRVQTHDNDKVDILRCLVSMDHKKKTCKFLGRVPEGCEMNMVLLGKKDIEVSARNTFVSMLERINENKERKYSLILCSSCIARYSLIVSDKNVEGRAYAYKLPEGMNLSGYYGFSEFCPASGKDVGGLYNTLNNESLTLLAI